MERMISGVQPSGSLTIGNYIGAMKNFVKLQDKYELMVFIADLHAITVKTDKEKLKERIRDVAALYIACGLDPKKVCIFKQSDVLEHANLGYILTCNAYMGELSRMTQYKEKTKKIKNDNIPAGLFVYPALMAADILLYDANFVPVGADQKQHLEITRDIAIRFNNRYGETFTVPSPVIAKFGSRIKSLTEPDKKMSKSSADDDKGSVRLLDDLKVARKKIMGAVTDSDNLIKYDVKNKPGISNLITIYSDLKNKSIKEVEEMFKNSGYGAFKKEVADVVVETLEKIQEKYKDIINSGKLDKILNEGASKARKIAEKKLIDVKSKIGFI